ncbi:MAG TPA: GGDEF domain-containing protein [Solirubrobacteraceae bacterium]|jgi:hypothetical protein|nr:GGDEF domain-containing protein [Solirubrobacteraceae bacterium]
MPPRPGGQSSSEQREQVGEQRATRPAAGATASAIAATRPANSATRQASSAIGPGSGANRASDERGPGAGRRDEAAYVDGLKATNDSRGHAAGDRMLSVVDALRAKLRPHDLVIRFGGDEFLCVVSGLSPQDAATRLALVNLALAASPEHGSITVGLAALEAADTARELVARADAALYEERQRHRSAGDRSAGR